MVKTTTIELISKKEFELIRITKDILKAVEESGVQNGLYETSTYNGHTCIGRIIPINNPTKCKRLCTVEISVVKNILIKHKIKRWPRSDSINIIFEIIEIFFFRKGCH